MAAAADASRSNDSLTQHSIYDLEHLRKQCRWIRDDLDPQVARDGPDALHSDDVLELDEFLRHLLSPNLRLEDVRFSRLHLALIAICGQATRWPSRLIDRAEAVRALWESNHSSLSRLTIPLYEPGGRLHGICRPQDLEKDKLMAKWMKEPGTRIDPMRARRLGHLGFKPGDWWINPLFALRDGIIDSADPAGGIVADVNGAYAVLMTEDAELKSPTPEAFTYRAKHEDRGRFRLTAATRESRGPVRILRSHSLRSLWAPKAGIRYDGLHVVVGWSVMMDPKTRRIAYEIHFRRSPSEVPMHIVLRRPFADEVEDYREYKRLRQAVRDEQGETRPPRRIAIFIGPVDGTFDSNTSSPQLRHDSLLE